MTNQVDEYRRLMDKRPPLHLATSNMRRWIGMIIQQYGTVAHLLTDLQVEFEYYKKQNKIKQAIIVHLTKKAEKWDRFITDLEKESERTSIVVEKFDVIQAHISEAGKALETNRKLEAIKKLADENKSHIFKPKLMKILEDKE